MRTTLTIDAAVAQQLRAVMRKRKLTLKDAVNEALRAGIPQIGKRKMERKSFTVVPHSMGLKPGVDPDKIGDDADEIRDAEKLRTSVH